MVFVLLTYGGWNEAAYISAEVRDRDRNMVRALLFAIMLSLLIFIGEGVRDAFDPRKTFR